MTSAASSRSATLLVENIDVLATMDDERRVLIDAWLLIDDDVIVEVGRMVDGAPRAARRFDAAGHVVLPGLVNTHHHFFQTLLRAFPALQDVALFEWLRELSQMLGAITEEMVEVSSRVAVAELMLSGCTTTQDHAYVAVGDVALDVEVAVARDMGIRFHLGRGSITRSTPFLSDESTEREDDVLASCERLIEAYHDPRPRAMTRVELAPTSLFSVSPELLRDSVELARRRGVRLHIHCSETREEVAYCLDSVGKRPAEHAAELGFIGPDVCFAHAVHLDREEIALLARTGTGVAHCPTSNMRLGSGIAPIVALLEQGVRVGLGVDGSASNDGSHLAAEARMALLAQRVKHGAAALTAQGALELATRGGAAVLGRDDIGRIAPGMAADIVGFPRHDLRYAGAVHDPVAALVLCSPTQVAFSIVNGRFRVRDARLIDVDLYALVARQNQLAAELVRRAAE
jgi:8-oxoguanine deaminase